MAYRFLTNEDLNYAASDGTAGSYKTMMESALNNLESDGWVLEHIEPATENSQAYYIFRTEQKKRKGLNG